MAEAVGVKGHPPRRGMSGYRMRARHRPSRSAPAAPAALAVAVALAGLSVCGSSSPSAKGAANRQTIEIALSDDGCNPNALEVAAGPTTFHVTNRGSAAVTEFEVTKNGKILGEVENIAAGLDRSFSITLQPGTYATKCTGGTHENGTLTVGAATATTTPAATAAAGAAVKTYIRYLTGQARQLLAATKPFVAAVKAGDIAAAKAQYAKARYHYETIEPIAETFGTLDPQIDARAGDVSASRWTGFHRIEKALWADGDIAAMGPVADKLLADITRIADLVPHSSLEPAQIANGAVDLLNEVSSSKITGEEDRYSHTDLSDFAANVAGSQAAFAALEPMLAARDASLAATIKDRFAEVTRTLDQHRDPSTVANGYVLYPTLTASGTRTLANRIDALAEPMSKVASTILT